MPQMPSRPLAKAVLRLEWDAGAGAPQVLVAAGRPRRYPRPLQAGPFAPPVRPGDKAQHGPAMKGLGEPARRDGPSQSVANMLQPLVRAAANLTARTARDPADRYAWSLGLFVPQQFDRLLEEAGSADLEKRAAAILVLATEGVTRLSVAQRDTLVAAVLRQPAADGWRKWEAVDHLCLHMPLLGERQRLALCDALFDALAKAAAVEDGWQCCTVVRSLRRFLPGLEDARQRALVRHVIAAGVPWALGSALRDLSPRPRAVLLDAAMTQYRNMPTAERLGKLTPSFAHLTQEQRDTLFDVALADKSVIDPLDVVGHLAMQWEHLSPGQRKRLLDAALCLAADHKDGCLALADLGPVLGYMDPAQQEAVVNAATALPGPDCLIAIKGMAAGMAEVETSLRNRLVVAAIAVLDASKTSGDAAKAIGALLPALACLDPRQQAALVTAGLALPEKRDRFPMVASLLAASLRLEEGQQARLRPQLVDAALQMLLGGGAAHSKELCAVLAGAFGHLDTAQRAALLGAACQPVKPPGLEEDLLAQPQYGAILVAARNLPLLTPAERDELVAAVAQIVEPPVYWQKEMRAEVLVALAEGVEKLGRA